MSSAVACGVSVTSPLRVRSTMSASKVVVPAGRIVESNARHFLRGGALRDGIGATRLRRRSPSCPGVGHAVVDFFRLRAPVERRDHDARELAGPVQRRRFPAVLQHDEQTVAALQAELAQAIGDTQNHCDATARRSAAHRHRRARARSDALHAVQERASEIKHVRPPSLASARRRAATSSTAATIGV